jgi:hypothetical protein
MYKKSRLVWRSGYSIALLVGRSRDRTQSGFGGLGICVLASGTQDRGFAPDRSRRTFHNEKIHSTQYDRTQKKGHLNKSTRNGRN